MKVGLGLRIELGMKVVRGKGQGYSGKTKPRQDKYKTKTCSNHTTRHDKTRPFSGTPHVGMYR